MMRKLAGALGLVGVLTVLLAPGLAQSDNSKALRYHEVLVKRAAPGYLYDRFYDAWLDTGTLDELEQFLKQQVEQKDTTADRLLLAFFYAKQGDDVQALQQFQAALKNDPGNADAWYQKGVIEARMLDFEAAIADLQTARDANPDEKLAADIAKLLGKVYARNHQIDKALETWQKLLAANPTDEHLCEDIIELQIDEGLYEEAAALSEQLVSRTTDRYEQVIRRVRTGDIYQRAGQRAKALEVYSSTLEDVGHGTWLEREILAQIEQLFRREDDLTGLKQQYEKLLHQHARRIQIHKQYAKLLSELGEHEAAREQFEEILRLTPGDRGNVEAYVSLLAGAGKLDEAIEVLQTLIEQNPRDGELRLRLAGLHHQAKDSAAAGQAVQDYLGVSDKSEYAYLRSARLLQQFELYDEAERGYERLTAAYPDSGGAQEARADFLYGRGKKEEALAIWRKLAEGKGRSEVVHVARILTSRNEHQAAYDLLTAREAEFSDDPIFVSQLVQSAIALEQFDEALPRARRLVTLAQTASELESAVEQTARVADKSNKLAEIIRDLAGKEKRTVQETCLLAELWERSGDSRRADRVLAEVEDQQNLLVINQQIRLYTQRQSWQQAADAMQRLVETPEGRKSVNVRRLVELYQRDYQIDEALRWIQEWKKLSPGSTMPWVTESRLLVQQGKTGEAISRLQSAVQQFDDYEELRARLAQLYLDDGNLADAQRIYWRLYEDGKDLAAKLRWVQRLAEVAEMQGKVDQLVEKFEQRHRTNRTSIEPLMALAEIHRVADNYEERRNALLEATRIKGDDLELLRQIARIEEEEGDWERALATWERAAKLDTTTRTREQIARLHLNFGDPDKGYAILHELAGSQQSDARSVEAVADAMVAVGDWERVIDFLQPSLSQYPDDYRLRYLYAVAQEETGQTAEAVQTFLSLLEVDKEITGPFTAQQPPWGPWLAPLNSLMPQEAIDYLELGWQAEVVYSHRNRGRGSFYATGYRGVGRGSVTMPHDVNSVRQYSLTHLLTMADAMDEEEVSELADDMRRRGVAHVEVLLEMSPEIEEMDGIAELAAKYPNNQGLMALFLLMNMEGLRQGDPDLAAKGYELFREDRPQLALIAAVHVASLDKERQGLLDEALAKLSEVKQPNLFTVMCVASVVGESGDESALSAEHRQQLLQRVVQWYPQLTHLGPQAEMVFMTVAESLLESNQPAEFFAFLDQEVTRWRSGNRLQSSGMYGWHSGSMDESFLSPLSFPPATLSNFPPHVQMLAADTDGDLLQMLGEGEAASLDAESVSELLEPVKDPTLKILLASNYGEPELCNRLLAEMLRAEQPEVDAFLLAAAKATDEEHFGIAAQLLDRARYLPMTREVRQRIDAALVAMALNYGPLEDAAQADAPESPLAKEFQQALESLNVASNDEEASRTLSISDIGRKAALRLRRVNLSPNERVRLVAALEELDLADEAEKLAANIATAGTYSPSYSSSGTSTDVVTRLLDDGKRDQAVRLLANDMAVTARSVITPPYEFDAYEFHEIRQTIQLHGLADELLAKMDPGDTGNALKYSQFAVACEILGETERAKAAYEKALAQRENDDGVRLRLMLLVAEDDVDAAVGHLDQFDRRNLERVGFAITQLSTADWAPDHQTKFARALIRFIGEMEDTDKLDLSWVSRLAERWSPGGAFVGSFGDVVTTRPEMEWQIDAQAQQLHAELCRTMLTIPQLARDGFSQLLSVAEAENKVTDEFNKMALDALLIYKPSRGSRTAYVPSASAYPDPFGDVQRPTTPEEFLVRHAWKTNNLAFVEDQVLPALEKANQTDLAEQMQKHLALYTCDAADFLALAEDFVDATQHDLDDEFDPGLLTVLEVWVARRLDVDITPIVVKTLAAETDRGRYYAIETMTPIVVEYSVALARRDRSKLPGLLHQLTEQYLGPKEQWQEDVSDDGWRVYGFDQLMQSMRHRKELVFPVLDFRFENGLSIDVNYEYEIRSIIENSDNQVDTMVELLELSPWLTELEDLNPYLVFAESGETVMASMLRGFPQWDSETMKEVRQKLKQRHPKAFGANLIVAALKDDSSIAVLELLGKHEAKLQALPDEKKTALIALMQGLVADDLPQYAVSNLSDGARRIHAWLEQSQSVKQRELVNQVLEAEDLSKIGTMVLGEALETMHRMLREAIDSDPAEAQRLFDKMRQIVKLRVEQGYRAQEESASYVLAELLETRRDLATVAFVIDVLLGEGDVPIPVTARIRHLLRASVTAAWREVSAGHGDKLKALQALYATLGKHLKSRPTTVLAGAYRELLGDLSPNGLQAAVEWAGAESESGDFPEIAAELAAAAQWVKAFPDGTEDSTAGESPTWLDLDPYASVPELAFVESVVATSSAVDRPKQLADYHKHYVAVLGNDPLPLTWRLGVAEMLFEIESAALPVPVVLTCADVCRQGFLSDKIAVRDSQFGPVVVAMLFLEHDETWTEAASELAAAWNQRILWPTRSGPGSGPPTTGFHPSSDHAAVKLTALLKLNLLLENDTDLARMLGKFESQLSGQRATLALLVRHGRKTIASKLFRSSWDQIDGEQGLFIAPYDQALHEALSEFLETISREDQKYLAELLLVTLPDARRDGGQPAVDHDSRIREVASRFSQVNFTSNRMKERALILLSEYPHAAEFIVQPLAEVAADIDLAELIDLQRSYVENVRGYVENERLFTRKWELAMSHLRVAVAVADFKPVAKAIDLLAQEDEHNMWHVAQSMRTIPDTVIQAVLQRMAAWDDKQLAEFLPLARQLAASGFGHQYYGTGDQQFEHLNVVAHALANEMDQLADWWKNLTDEQRARISTPQSTVWRTAAQVLPADDANLPRRMELAVNLFEGAQNQGWPDVMVGHGEPRGVYAHMLEFGLLSMDELLQYGSDLAGKAPLEGHAWAALAQLQTDADKLEAAAESWGRAIATGSKDRFQHQTDWRISQARVLKQLGRTDEARAVLENFDRSMLYSPSENAFNELLQQLNP